MSFNYGKLLGRLKEKGKTQDDLAKYLRISRTTISSRLNNKTDFLAREIQKACEFLDIPQEEIPDYFFYR